MPLSNELRDVAIEFQCPACSHSTKKMGSWVTTIGSFKCDGCKAKVRIGYEYKLAVFKSHLSKR